MNRLEKRQLRPHWLQRRRRLMGGVIEGFDIPDAPLTGGPWGRQAGAWVDVTEEAPFDGIIYGRQNGAWVTAAGGGGGLDIATGDARYVNQNGDTMTGDLTITKSIPRLILNKAAVAENNVIFGKLNNVFRWGLMLGNSDPESGGNSGSNFAIASYDNAGNSLGAILSIARATNEITANGVIAVNRAASNYFYKMQSSGSYTGTWGLSVLTGGQFCLDDGFGQWLRIHPNSSSTPGLVNVPCTIPSTSPSSGAFIVEGGVGVGGNMFVGGLVDINNDTYVGKVQTGVNSSINLRSAFDQQGWFNFWQGVQQRMSILCQMTSGDLLFARWNDAGAFVDTPVAISRANGLLTIAGGLGAQIYNSLGPDTRGLLRLMQPAGTPGVAGSIQGMYGSNFLGGIDFSSEGGATNSGYIALNTVLAGVNGERIRITANGDVGVGTSFPITFTVANRKFLTLQTEGLVSPVISLGINDGAPVASRAFGQLVFHNSARAGTDKRVAVIAATAQNAVVDTSTLVFQVWQAGVAKGLLEVRGHEEVVKVLAPTVSTSPTTGAFQVDGGVGVVGRINAGEWLVLNNGASAGVSGRGGASGTCLRVDGTSNDGTLRSIGSMNINVDGGSDGGAIEFNTSPVGSGGVVQNRMVIRSSGDVGIGTVQPNIAHSSIAGRLRFTVSGEPYGANFFPWFTLAANQTTPGNNFGNIYFVNTAAAPVDKRMGHIIGMNPTEGGGNGCRLVFGTTHDINVSSSVNRMHIDYTGQIAMHANLASTSPTTGTLIVTGGLGVSGQISAGPSIVSLGDSASIHINALSSTDPILKFWSNNVTQWTFANQVAGSNLLIIHDSDTTHGVTLSQNTTSWAAFSDKRMRHKQNARTVSGLLTKLDKFRLVEYGRDHSEIGVLAQELHTFMPQLTIHGDDDDRIIDRVTDGRVWGVKPSEAAFVALQIAKEIWEDVDRRLTHLETTH